MNTQFNDTVCIFVPLEKEKVLLIWAWMHWMAPNNEGDLQISEKINSALSNVFELHKLLYNDEIYGKPTIDKIRLFLGSDGICIPEVCFLNPSPHLARVTQALSPFAPYVNVTTNR